MSIMSYRGVDSGYSFGSANVVATPMIYDIAAVQTKYGASSGYMTGATKYGNSTIEELKITGDSRSWAIYDTGGRDEIDASHLNFSKGVVIDLRGGVDDESGQARVSKFAGEYVSIAWQAGKSEQNLACEIEVARGTSKADTIIGGMGANTLEGGGDADILISGNRTNEVTIPADDDVAVDSLVGGAGKDSIWAGLADYWVNDESADDLWLNGTGDVSAVTITGGKGADTITCYSGRNEIYQGKEVTDPNYIVYINPSSGTSLFLNMETDAVRAPRVFVGDQELVVNSFDLSDGGSADVGQGWRFARVGFGAITHRLYNAAGETVMDVHYLRSENAAAPFTSPTAGLAFTRAVTEIPEPGWLAPALAASTDTTVSGGGQGGGATVSGTSGNDNLVGNASSQTMSGLAGSDTISGGGGMDTLDGGADADTLSGGAGPDVFRYTSVSESQAASGTYDRLADFSAAEDSIDLRGMGFSSLVTTASTANASQLRISYTASGDRTFVKNDQTGFTVAISGNHYNGTVIYENITADSFVFTDFTYKNGGQSMNDVLTGTAGRDVMRGYGGNDSLSGEAGWDTLEGGLGVDTLSGGVGSDIFRFTQTADSSGSTYDRITDFDATYDRIDVRGMGFASITNAASTANATELRITYNASGDRTFVKNDQTGFVFVMNGEHHLQDAAFPSGDLTQSDFIFA